MTFPTDDALKNKYILRLCKLLKNGPNQSIIGGGGNT